MNSVRDWNDKQRLIKYRAKVKRDKKKAKFNRILKERAICLSASLIDNATKSELSLVSYFKKHRVKYEFQYPVVVGNKYYCLDFYFPEKKLGVEIDGNSHASKEAKIKDAKRTENINSLGIQIIRFSNYQAVNDPEFIRKRICLIDTI